jgi:8-oxo-dGTP pyrophosphatase MutT (NUDIX family)
MSCTAAGIIIFRNISGKNEILGLEALRKFKQRNNGIYDIPKGRIDLGETPIQCAVRECWEEAGINRYDIVAGPLISGPMYVWLAKTEQVPIISPNPETGYIEHLGYEWLSINDILENCLDYLTPSLLWAKDILCQHHS